MLRKLLPMAVAALLVVACADAPTEPPLADVAPEFSQEKAELLAGLSETEATRIPDGRQLASTGPITYEGVLVNGHSQGGTVPQYSYRESADWDYWSFCAVEGSTIDVAVHRTTSLMDAGATLFSGITTVADGLRYNSSVNPDLTFITWADDNNGVPHGVGGPYADPRIQHTAGSTGYYTLAVFDVIGAESGERPYDIEASGLGAGATATAALTLVEAKSQKSKKAKFTVEFGCTDDCGAVVETSAMLNGIAVENGQVVELRLKSEKSGKSGKSAKSNKSTKSKKSGKSKKSLKIEGSSFELLVTCTNETGNTSTVTVEPTFPEKSTKSGKG